MALNMQYVADKMTDKMTDKMAINMQT